MTFGYLAEVLLYPSASTNGRLDCASFRPAVLQRVFVVYEMNRCQSNVFQLHAL